MVKRDHLLAMKKIRKDAAAFRATCPTILNDDQFDKLLAAFYSYAEGHGWHESLDDAISMNGKFIYAWQQELAECILRSVYQKLGDTVAVSAKRQEGKTDILALILTFCYETYYITFGEPFAIGIVGPGRMMSTTVFKRLNNYLIAQGTALAIDQGEYKETLRGDSLAAFSISETGGTTIEGKSLNFILRDESHEGSDRRWRDEVLWTTAAKEGATIAMLGCAGYKKCDYMSILQEGNRENQKVMILGYNELKPYMMMVAEKGYRHAQGWLKRTEKLVRMNGGWDSPETLKNVFCQWQCHLENYLTEEQIEKAYGTVDKFDADVNMEPLVAFIDMGYSGDRTWAVVMNMKSQIVDMIMLKDAQETRALRDQLEEFMQICDDRGYIHSLHRVGIDRTGLGIGAHEMLQEMCPCETVPITFSLQKKQEMYLNLKNHIITTWEEDRITIPPDHKHTDMLVKELTEIEQTPSELGALKFHAATGAGEKKYDDLPDTLAGCVHVLYTYKEQFSNIKGYSKRHNRQETFKKKLLQKAKRALFLKESSDPMKPNKRKPRKKSIIGSTIGDW